MQQTTKWVFAETGKEKINHNLKIGMPQNNIYKQKNYRQYIKT